MPQRLGHFIAGEWREGRGGYRPTAINPATSAVVAEVSFATTSDLEDAAQAADAGFRVWRRTSAVEREAILRATANLLRERSQSIASSITTEQGKPLKEASAEVAVSADLIDWFAADGRRANGVLLPPRVDGGEQRLVKEPIGPIAAFTPWNFPISQTVRKIGPALAAGCSVVLKPPENTPSSVVALVQCFADAGLPPGVLNMVFGVPAMVSEFLIPHPAIRKVSFTGSVPVGKHLAALAGRYMKPATMELGGHAPVVVCDDVDIESTVSTLVGHKYRNAGQVCVSPTRFLVQERIYEAVVSEFVRLAEKIVVGDGALEQTQMGPLVSAARQQSVSDLVSEAVSSGAVLRTGGNRIGNSGSFYAPTVLTDIRPEMRVMKDEPFGPVALFMPVTDDDAALVEANRLSYGLAAYVFAKSPARAQKLYEGIEAGMITVNHLGFAVPEAHFGGVKDSGYGSEGGSEAIEAYLLRKFVTRAPYAHEATH